MIETMQRKVARPLAGAINSQSPAIFSAVDSMPKVRNAAVAGGFYPSDPRMLASTIDQMLAQVPQHKIDGKIVALVAPHAGYVYSGPVAAHAYAALADRQYSRVVVIAPSHCEAFAHTSVYDGDAYATPLGSISVDCTFVRRLAKCHPSIQLSGHGHRPTAEGAEHSLEVQLPWLQRVLGDFQLVPIVMGEHSYESSRALGVALAGMIEDGKTLIVASSDLSHYHSYDEAVELDHKTLDAMGNWDYFSMARNFQARIWEACGGAPIVAAMIASERLGATQAEVLKYANSGDTSGSRARVVGYGAGVFVKTPHGQEAEMPFVLQEEDKAELLSLAHASVECAVRENRAYQPAPTASPSLNQERGAFVTLHKAGQLRGCIGYTSVRKPLFQTVRDTAALAALRDPRFAPVTAAELSALDFEISVLSPLHHLLDPERIEVGRHGLLIKRGVHEGLLLPQVPVEQGWDRETFLAHTCQKAGLPADSWKDQDTDIFSFTAEVFADHKP
jgi:AmmeMemoRadiSam system protein B/AmmeMemoRadiSam system protein A